MTSTTSDTPQTDFPCCPSLKKDDACDVLDFRYRLKHFTNVIVANRPVRVEVGIHVRFERCPGPLVLGDLVYTTTLLPGEKVRLFTSDRRTRFSLDTASKVSYRHEQTSEERYYMASMHDFMADVTVRDAGSASSSSHGSTEGHGETSSALETIFSGPSVDVSGSFDAESASSFLTELSQHAESSDRRAELATRTASSVSVGEVSSRSHTEGESEDHFESASRSFSNPNKCHAITYLFYQINKTQRVRLTIEAIERRVIDPVADTRVTHNPFVSRGSVTAIPSAVLATDANRLTVEDAARRSVVAHRQASSPVAGLMGVGSFAAQVLAAQTIAEPIPTEARDRALRYVDEQLIEKGLMDKNGRPTEKLKVKFNFERQSSLPTPGLMVRGCLDECDVCEPALDKEIDLNLQHLQLKNDLLAKQIALLENAQEYRCCPPSPIVELEE